jgi:hypothetical protein
MSRPDEQIGARRPGPRWIAPVLLLSSLALAAPLHAQPAVPVMYGGEADFDACPTVGEVAGLDPQGDNFLALRAGPGGSYKMLKKLGPGTRLILCDARGGWLGVVVDNGSGCGTTSPIAKRQPYRGPCRSGWVFKRYVREVAG